MTVFIYLFTVAAIASGVGGTVIVAFAVLVGVTMYFKKYPFKIRRRNERSKQLND